MAKKNNFNIVSTGNIDNYWVISCKYFLHTTNSYPLYVILIVWLLKTNYSIHRCILGDCKTNPSLKFLFCNKNKRLIAYQCDFMLRIF